MHIAVKDLPESIQSALRSVSYGGKDISVQPKERVSIQCSGGAGQRGFAILLDLASGRQEIHQGSWGGANIFNQHNSVDLDDRMHDIPVGGAVITGSQGNRTFATVYLHPDNMVKLLPAPAELSDKERRIMYAFGCLKSGDYRKEELSRAGATEADIDALISRGFLKRDGRGVQITTAGKNTRRPAASSFGW
jgi:hypothetical protein